MSRWHAHDCEAPRVVVDTEAALPRCLACGASFAKSRAQSQSQSGPLPIPPDEAPGRLNLYWPRTVPYRSPQHENPPGPADPAGSTQATSAPAPLQECYTPRLKPNQVRLLRVSAAAADAPPSPPSVVHVHLEVHDHDRCPEYETLSYTWGGEDGDSAPSQPVFIGDFWDAVWQTKNCCAMLQFLRPVEGFRLVWVDALCINQKDDTERDQQVAAMARIYDEARRVVVYLGPDVATQTPGMHPRRQKLQDSLVPSVHANAAAGHEQLDLRRLLERRYFSRIWVVQELALSRQISIALRDLEVWADALTPAALQRNHPRWQWRRTRAPWVQNMAQREIPDTDLYQVMRATTASDSSDVRDRVFGVHALLGAGGGRGLEPDYSLSALHCFLGTFAHLILNLGHVELMHSASGLAAQPPWPSWMPDYRSTPWRQILHGAVGPVAEPEKDPFYRWWCKQKKPATNDKSSHGLLSVSAEDMRRKTDEELYADEVILKHRFKQRYESLSDDDLPVSAYSTPYLRYITPRPKGIAWNFEATVDTATGGIALNLIHLLRFPTVPRRLVGLPTELHRPVFEIVSGTRTGAKAFPVMYLVTDDAFDLSRVRPESDHLYILDQLNGSCLFLVLREAGPNTFKLVACCRQVWFHVLRETWTRKSYNTEVVDQYAYESRDVVRERQMLRHDNKLFLTDLQHSLFAFLESLPSQGIRATDYTWDETQELLLGTFFFDVQDRHHGAIMSSDLVSFCQGLLNEQRGTQPGLLPCYAALFSPALNARVRDNCLELSIPSELWDLMHEYHYTPAYTRLFKEWRFETDTEGENKNKPSSWSTSKLKLSLLRRGNKTVCVRASKDDIMALGVQTDAYERLSTLTRAHRITGEEETLMYRRRQRPNENDHRIAFPSWPKQLMDVFAIDGSTQRVTIA